MPDSILSSEKIQALRAVDSPTLSNAIAGLKVRDRTEGFVSMDVRCQFPDLAPMVGYAVTCTADTAPITARRPNRLRELLEAIAAAPKPAVVVAQYVGSDRLHSCFLGEILTTAFQTLGAVGCLTDCGFRDLKGIQARSPGFQVFAPGAVVTGNALVLEIGVPVNLAGLQIQPGDLLHGDDSGVLLVPAERLDEILENARGVVSWESGVLEFIQRGPFTVDELMKHFH